MTSCCSCRLTELTASLAQPDAPPHGLVLLVPLVLGIGKVNPAYFDQLQQSLQWPQSLGVVGGRPGSSLYFVGHQGGQLLYLDPHTVQEVGAQHGMAQHAHRHKAVLARVGLHSCTDVLMSMACNVACHQTPQTVHEPGHMESYHCDTVAVMPMASIDPSLALALYVASPGTPQAARGILITS